MQEGHGCAMEVEVNNKIQSTIEVEGKGIVHKMRAITKLNLASNKLYLIGCAKSKCGNHKGQLTRDLVVVSQMMWLSCLMTLEYVSWKTLCHRGILARYKGCLDNWIL